jgi:multiple sugar transport system permease protein
MIVKKVQISLFKIFKVFVILIALWSVLIPFIYLFLNSIKLERDFITIPPKLIPTEITPEYYQKAFSRDSKIINYITNSIIVTICVVIISVFIGSLAAYGLSHLRVAFRFFSIVVFGILMVRFYPKVVMVVPYFILMKNFKLLDTLLAVIIAHVSIGIPFVVWLMLGFYDEIPKELEESAMIDGCGVWVRFMKIVFPVTLPGIATAAIMIAILSWNEFLIASSVVSVNAKTLPILISGYISDKGINWGPMSAVSTVIIFPMFVFALFTQKYLIRGLTFGAVKG